MVASCLVTFTFRYRFWGSFHSCMCIQAYIKHLIIVHSILIHIVLMLAQTCIHAHTTYPLHSAETQSGVCLICSQQIFLHTAAYLDTSLSILRSSSLRSCQEPNLLEFSCDADILISHYMACIACTWLVFHSNLDASALEQHFCTFYRLLHQMEVSQKVL